MKDIKARIEKLRVDAADCVLISKLATVPEKRAIFEKLAEEYSKLARELETLVINHAIPDSDQK